MACSRTAPQYVVVITSLEDPLLYYFTLSYPELDKVTRNNLGRRSIATIWGRWIGHRVKGCRMPGELGRHEKSHLFGAEEILSWPDDSMPQLAQRAGTAV